MPERGGIIITVLPSPVGSLARVIRRREKRWTIFGCCWG